MFTWFYLRSIDINFAAKNGSRPLACFHWGMAVNYGRYKYVTVFIFERLRNGRFASEISTWIQKWFKISAGTSIESAPRISAAIYYCAVASAFYTPVQAPAPRTVELRHMVR
jgi:hypothetical protein